MADRVLTKAQSDAAYPPMRGTGTFVPVSSRGGHVYIQLVSSPPQGSMTSRVAHVATDDITSLRFYYGNFYFGVSSDGLMHDGTAQITVKNKVQLADGSEVLGFTAGGSKSLVIDTGGYGYLDVSVNIPKGTLFYEVTNVVGTVWPVGNLVNYANQGGLVSGITNPYDATGFGFTGSTAEGDNLASGGADLSAIGASNPPASFVRTYSAFAVLGTVRSPVHSVVAVIGDSIDTDSNDFAANGYLWRALGNQHNFLRLSHGGDRASFFASATKRGWTTAFLRYATHAMHGHKRNDLADVASLATIQANMITNWTLSNTVGAQVWDRTALPGSSSTDNWTTLTNQTTASFNAVRLTLNAWLRDGAPMQAGAAVAVGTTGVNVSRCAVYSKTGALVSAASGPTHLVTGILEFADVVESSRDSGKWAVSQIRTITDATGVVDTTNNKYLMNSAAQGLFSAADQGRQCVLPGAGSAGATILPIIMQVVSATQVKFTSQASTAVTNATMNIGILTADGTHPSAEGHKLIVSSGCLSPLLATLS